MTKDNKNKKQVAKHNWYIKHQEEQSLFMKNWRKEHEGYSSRKHKEWYQNHKKEWAEYQRERRKSLIIVLK